MTVKKKASLAPAESPKADKDKGDKDTDTQAQAEVEPAPPDTADALVRAAKPKRGRRARGARWDRIWQTSAERTHRAAVAATSARQSADLERALVTRHFAARAIDPADPSPTGSSIPVALGLLRDAAFWALCAGEADPPPATAAEAVERLGPDALAEILPTEPEREAARAALADTRELAARRPIAEQAAAARALERLTDATLARVMRPRRGLRRIFARRVAIVLVAIAFVIAASRGAIYALQPPSLTLGKPWRASSALDTCRPHDHWCADAVTDIFFCTTDEDNPWIEYDLGAPQSFSKIVVLNRTDCCPDRAVPLALEVSDDRANWREVTRRNETFWTWKTSFADTQARYVRLRALRKTILHLESFDLY